MERFYFTFGSDPGFPYGRGDFVIVIGSSYRDCMDTFKQAYPNRPGSGAMNCADYYSATEWPKIKEKYYPGKMPKKILVSDTAYGKKPASYHSLWVYVPEKGHLLFIQEMPMMGEESPDTIGYDIYDMDDNCVETHEGGLLALGSDVEETYGCLADAIPDVLDCIYDDMFLDATILKAIQ